MVLIHSLNRSFDLTSWVLNLIILTSAVRPRPHIQKCNPAKLFEGGFKAFIPWLFVWLLPGSSSGQAPHNIPHAHCSQDRHMVWENRINEGSWCSYSVCAAWWHSHAIEVSGDETSALVTCKLFGTDVMEVPKAGVMYDRLENRGWVLWLPR